MFFTSSVEATPDKKLIGPILKLLGGLTSKKGYLELVIFKASNRFLLTNAAP